MEFAGSHRVEAEVGLVFPAGLEACFAQRVVAVLSAGEAFGEVGGVSGDLVVPKSNVLSPVQNTSATSGVRKF